jgi:hypothetical protein
MTRKLNILFRSQKHLYVLVLIFACLPFVLTDPIPVAAVDLDVSRSLGALTRNSNNSSILNSPLAQLTGLTTVYLPLICNGDPPVDTVQNGGFESGHLAWNEYSEWGYDLIVDQTLAPVAPLSGSWLAWLGGADNEVSILSQEIYIPVGRSILNFWYATFSEDNLGDYFYVYIGDLFAGGENISSYSATNEWVRQVRDFSVFAGTTQTISFVVETNGEFNTNVFLDNISFETTASLSNNVRLLPGNTRQESSDIGVLEKMPYLK